MDIEYKSPLCASNFLVGELVDCLDERGYWLNAEITEISPTQLKVHYSGYHRKFDRWVPNDPSCILRQWRVSSPFALNNRLDVLDTTSQWREARVIDQNDTQIKVHYKGYTERWDEWIPHNSERIREIGSKSSAFGIGKLDPHCSVRYGKRAIQPEIKKPQLNLQRETIFTRALEARNFRIFEVEGDGNCLFRSVSHQLYGSTDYHRIIRMHTVEYLSIEKEYFSQFVVGDFEQYLAHQSLDGAWGDDVEIQAISEIYNRAIQIYAYASSPMRTFHEEAVGGSPIRLSYHGFSHYNSIVVKGDDSGMLKENPGAIEENAIAKARSGEMSSDVARARETFGHADLEETLQASLREFNDGNIEQAVKQSEFMQTEQALLEQVIEQSRQEVQQSDIDAAIQLSLQGNSESIQYIMSFGFTHDQAMQAWNAVGDNPELMLDYLLNIS